MNALKKTLFVLAVVSVTAYTVRHIYLKWFEPKESVLDKYADSSSSDIKKATSIEQLEKLYTEAHQKVKSYDADNSNPKVPRFEREQTEPYKTEYKIREAITDWENKSKEIFELRFYWAVGFLLVAGGFALYKWINQWFGLTVIIAGFAEKIYWTSPTFLGASGVEYDRLLTNKIIFSIGTLIFLITVGLLTDTLKPKQETQSN